MLTPEQARRLAAFLGPGLDGRTEPARPAEDRPSPASPAAPEVLCVRRTTDGPRLLSEPVPAGASILEHAEQRALGDRARLELHAEACALVATAHAQGVLHRDLRPANVLVRPSGAVAIIRFGGCGTGATEEMSDAVQTTITSLAESMRYLGPEQCSGPTEDIDARCDVYALGVILYELLCGVPPLDLRNATLSKALEIVRTAPPRPPSELRPELAGPVERVVLRAIAKLPAERHASAAALEHDVRGLAAAGAA